MGELREDELLDALEEAMRAQLVREEGDAGEVAYDFVHALIREVLYERLSLRRRMTFHQKVGEALERQYAGRTEAVVEDLAHHFTRAPHGEGLEKAIRYSLEAARKAMGLFAHEEAVRYYQNAAELLGETGDEVRLAETHVALGEPFVYLDQTPAAVAAYEKALKFYERQGTSADVARVHRLIGSALQWHWDFSDAIPHLERALEHLSAEEHAADVIRTHLDLARAKTFSGMVEEAEQHAAEALALAKAHGALSMQAAAHTALGLIAHTRVDIDGAMTHNREAIRLAKESADPEAYSTLGRSLNNMALMHQERSEHGEAFRLQVEALSVARRAKNLAQIGFANIRLAGHHIWQGDWHAARQHILDNLQMHLSPAGFQQSEYFLRALDGELEAAVSLARDIREHHRHTGNVQGILNMSWGLAWHTLELGRIQDAREAAVEAAGIMEIHPHFFLWGVPFVAEALARGGDHERCEALCVRGEELSRAAHSPQGLAGALYGRAVLALERGDPGEAVRLLDEVVPLVKRHGLVLHARTLHVLARALTRRGAPGDVERAKAVLQECLTLLDQMGDTRKAQQIRGELAALASP